MGSAQQARTLCEGLHGLTRVEERGGERGGW